MPIPAKRRQDHDHDQQLHQAEAGIGVGAQARLPRKEMDHSWPARSRFLLLVEWLSDVLVDLEHRQVHRDDDEADHSADDDDHHGSRIEVSALTDAATSSS